MKPSLRYLERISLIVIISVPLLVLVTIAAKWNLFQSLFPFPKYLQLKNALFVVNFFGTILFFLALVIFSGFIPYQQRPLPRSISLICLVLISIPMFCISGFLAFSPDYLVGSAELKNHHYYVEVPGEFGDPVIGHSLYKCDDRDLNCEEIFMTVPAGGSTIYPASFITNDQSNEIHFFLGRELVYTDGPNPRSYHSQSFGMIENAYIYLYTYEKNSGQEFVISKCEGKYLDNNISCMLLPFQYSTKTFNKAEIVTDESTKEIRMLLDGSLIFSYDTAPHCHVDGCTITGQ